jgi:hypothetical protein
MQSQLILQYLCAYISAQVVLRRPVDWDLQDSQPDVVLLGSDGSVPACTPVLAAISPWLRRSLLTASCSLLNEQC